MDAIYLVSSRQASHSAVTGPEPRRDCAGVKDPRRSKHLMLSMATVLTKYPGVSRIPVRKIVTPDKEELPECGERC